MWGGMAGLVVFRKHTRQPDARSPGKGVECHTLKQCSQKFSHKKMGEIEGCMVGGMMYVANGGRGTMDDARCGMVPLLKCGSSCNSTTALRKSGSPVPHLNGSTGMSLEEVAPTVYRLAVPCLETRSDGGTVAAIAGEHTGEGDWGGCMH